MNLDKESVMNYTSFTLLLLTISASSFCATQEKPKHGKIKIEIESDTKSLTSLTVYGTSSSDHEIKGFASLHISRPIAVVKGLECIAFAIKSPSPADCQSQPGNSCMRIFAPQGDDSLVVTQYWLEEKVSCSMVQPLDHMKFPSYLDRNEIISMIKSKVSYKNIYGYWMGLLDSYKDFHQIGETSYDIVGSISYWGTCCKADIVSVDQQAYQEAAHRSLVVLAGLTLPEFGNRCHKIYARMAAACKSQEFSKLGRATKSYVAGLMKEYETSVKKTVDVLVSTKPGVTSVIFSKE